MTGSYWNMYHIFKARNISKLSESSTFSKVGFLKLVAIAKNYLNNKIVSPPNTFKSLHINIKFSMEFHHGFFSIDQAVLSFSTCP